MKDPRRSIPSVDALLSSDAFAPLRREWPRALIVTALQQELTVLRETLHREPDVAARDESHIAARVGRSIETLAGGTLIPVINATGVVLHTNLGRAPLADAAIKAIAVVAAGYSNLEYDTSTGMRGSRYSHCRDLLCRLTGAEDALVVNNNAGALVLALNTVSRGLETVVSRGELVEIGGAFRVPEILARSGARLCEVGSTNRTHLDDYRRAAGPDTGALLKVHPSNFEVAGYTAEVGVADLASVAAASGVPLIHDLGSGLLLDPAQLGLPPGEPTPARSLAAGAAIVTMSGDKLLGGPQCGIILGAGDLLERMRRNPLCRALRVDKLTLAALAATLRLYLEPQCAMREIPVLRMLTFTAADIEARAAALARSMNQTVRVGGDDSAVGGGSGMRTQVVEGTSAVGGGAAAAAEIPTALLLISKEGVSAHELDRRLRGGAPAVIVRIVDDHVAIDLRTVSRHEEPALIQALAAAVNG